MKKKFTTLLVALLLTVLLPMPLPAQAADSDADVCTHDWSEWEVVKEATVFRTGTKERFCWYCDSIQTKTTPKIKAYAKIAPKSLTLYKGKSKKLKVSYGRGDSVKKWKSSNKKLASVTQTGKIKANKNGKVKITVTLKSGKKATCKVRIITKKRKPKPKKTSGTVYWTPSGQVYHSTRSCPTLSRSRVVKSGSLASCPKKRPCKVCH